MEPVWQSLRQNEIATRVFRTYPGIVDAWAFLADKTGLVTFLD